MAISGAYGSTVHTPATYDRYQELRSFDESKAGVKGLVDSCISKILRMFIRSMGEIVADKFEESAKFTIQSLTLIIWPQGMLR